MRTDPGQPDAHTDEVLEYLNTELKSVAAALVAVQFMAPNALGA